MRRRVVDGRVWEAVCDFEDTVSVHAHDGAGGCGGKCLRAVLDDLHDHQGLDLDGAETG